MSTFRQQLSSTIFTKFIVAISGLALVLFLIAHLAGNLLIYGGPASFNTYAQGLKDLGVLLWIMRGGILFAFLLHIFLSIKLKNLNSSARPQGYSAKASVTSTIYSRSMLFSGLSILSEPCGLCRWSCCIDYRSNCSKPSAQD